MAPPSDQESRRRQAQTVRFGPFQADLHTGELRKHGVRIKLSYQPFEILRMLLDRPGELVTRDELKQHLWPGDTFVEFDRSLNAAVKKLRRALNDSPRNPRYIQTLPKRGYRFIGELQDPTGGAGTSGAQGARGRETTDGHPAGEAPFSRTGPWGGLAAAKSTLLKTTAVAAGVVIALVVVSQIGEFQDSRPEPAAEAGPLRFETRPVLELPGRVLFPVLSPDGKSAAFSWAEEEAAGEPGHRNLYIAAIDGGDPVRVTDNPDVEYGPSWSPDGRRIAFSRSGKAGGTYVVSLLDGSETRVAIVSSSPTSWTPDGKTLVGTYGKVWAASLETREQSYLISEDSEVNYVAAAVSPDGATLAVGGCRRPSGYSSCDLYLRPLESEAGELRRLTYQNGSLALLAWTPDSREVVYSMDGRMYRIVAAGGTQPGRLELLAGDAVLGQAVVPSLARFGPNGTTRMSFVRVDRDDDIWVTDLQEEPGSPGAYRKLIDSPGIDHYPEYSPDGTKIVFYSNRGDTEALWVADSNGLNQRQLTPSTFRARDFAAPSWSPDGRQIAFRASTPEDIDFHIYTVPAESGRPQRVTMGDDEQNPIWSRDGLYIYFKTNRSGQGEVWRVRSDGLAPGVQVNKTQMWSYAESPDGRYIYFCGSMPGVGYGGLSRIPVDGGEREEILRGFGFGTLLFREEGLYYLDHGKPGQRRKDSLVAFKRLDPETLEITEISLVKNPGAPDDFSLSPDGRLVLTSSREPPRVDIMLVDDFH